MSLETFKYNCNKCNFNSNYLSQWNKHISTEFHKTGKRKIRSDKKYNEKCSYCEYVTNGNTNMKQHILNEHGTSEERKSKFKYYCDYCDYGTFAKSFFEKHKQTKKHNTFMRFTEK